MSLAVATLLTLSTAASALTIVLDFNDPDQENTSTTIFAPSGDAEVETFDIGAYGFVEGARNTIYGGILGAVTNDFHNISSANGSPMPEGKQLDIDFEIGDIGNAPQNGDSEYFYFQIGVDASGSLPYLGFAGLGAARQANGDPHPSIGAGHVIGTIFTDNINQMAGLGNALTSGDLMNTVNAIAGTTAHEIAHTLSLYHIAVAGATTPTGLLPLMATGAIDLPNAARLNDREFSISGVDPQRDDVSVNYIQSLIDAVGLRDDPLAVAEPQVLALLLAGLLGVRRTRRER